MPKQVGNGPDTVGEEGGHSGGFVMERRMDAAEIVDGAKQKDTIGQGVLSAGDSMRAANERGEIRLEGAVQALDEGGINRSSALGALTKVDEHGTRATQDIARDVEAPIGVMLDDLGQGQTRP